MLQVVTIDAYWMGRNKQFAPEWTEDIQKNALETVRRVNALLGRLEADRVFLELHLNGTMVSSGWRPPSYNRTVRGAAAKSKHMTGEACDLYDPDGLIDDWCWEHQNALALIDLYMEHPLATKGWCHVQTCPPASQIKVSSENRKRWFYP